MAKPDKLTHTGLDYTIETVPFVHLIQDCKTWDIAIECEETAKSCVFRSKTMA